MKKVKIDFRKLFFKDRSEEKAKQDRSDYSDYSDYPDYSDYSEEELIKGVRIFGDQVLVKSMDVKTENGRTEFVCRLCKNRITYHYCGHCGHRLDSLMKCEGSCGVDYKTSPPYCFYCYEPTVKICKKCGYAVDISDDYCTFCGCKC